ncbi:quattro isoform X1 [Oryzias melastigma]|uniref:Quattro n=1 Tax=Oryzias melastigma TaxID=30732 RepID=A0A3B3DS57_ORYME|nr:quattro isoform X1 [Oryzias melastigma]
MNPESLDLSIQTALSALFPPFEVTAPIVISQLFRTIEERYHGDALQCLLDFLIPSKHVLESVQQAACAGYSDVVFRCEGWPLCLHDKTVIQLAPVNPLLLRPGDFYFQVEPFGDQAARIVLKSLLEEGCREVEETPIPETSYPCIFTEDWLNDINEGRHGTALSRCLLCTDQGVIKLPWAKIAIPEFLDRPKKMSVCGKTQTESKAVSAPSQFNAATLPVGAVISPRQDKMSASLRPVQSRLIKVEHERRVPKLGTKPLIKPVGWVSPNTWESHSFQGMEGDYVDLVDISKGKQRGSCEIQNKLVSLQPVRPPPPIPLGQKAFCRHAPQHAEDPCNPCSQMQPGQELSDPDLKCRYRESYLEALSNPVAFERGGADLLSALEEVHLCEEGDGKAIGAPEAPEKHLENICNGCNFPVECNESCQCNPNKLLPPENLDLHLLSSPEPEIIPKETISNLSVQAKQAPQQFGSTAVVHPPLDVTSVTCDAEPKPHQMGEAVKSSKHKVKGRSLSTVSETPAGSPVLYQLNSRSHSDVCPETIANLIHGRKGARPDQQAGRSERHKGSRKEFRSCRSETPSSTNELSATSSSSQQNLQTSESAFSRISSLLELGIISLPGSRDRNGRAVVEVHGDREEWMSPLVSAQSVCELLLYLHSIPRKDVRELGITLLINARKRPPPLHLYKALLMAQEQALHAVHCIIILMDKDTCPRPEKHPGLQMDMVTSLRALNKTVEASQVTSDLGGTFIYSHTDWLQFHRKLVSFMDELRGADSLLQMAIKNVDSRKQMDTTQEVQQSIQEQKILMKNVLEDARLVTLQREGGALLARMKREEFRFPQSEDYRDALESVTSLYNQVEEKLHMLVMRSNESLQHLEVLLKIRETEAEVITAGMWFSTDGEQRLKDFCTTDDTDIKKTFQDFSLFLALSKEKQQHALTYVKEAEEIIETRNSSPAADIFRTLTSTFKSNMEDFMLRAERRQKELSSMAQVYTFCEQASSVAKECAQFVEQVEEGCLSAQTLSTLQLYKERLGGEFSDSQFQALRAKACTMGSGASGMMKMWNAARVRCQEVKQRLEETQRKKRGKDKNQIPQTAAVNPRGEETQIKGGSELEEAEGSSILQPICQTKAADTTAVPHLKHDFKNGLQETPTQDSKSLQLPEPHLKNAQVSPQVLGCHPEGKWRPRDHRSESDLRTAKVPKGLLLHQNLGRSLSEGSRATSMTTFVPAAIRHHHCHSRTQSLDENMQPNHNPHLERPPPEQKSKEARGDDGKREELTDSCKDLRSSVMLQTPTENTSNFLRVRKILEELLSTEREYVKALAYVREHYFPELERPDVPQDLRGQRGSVFGNLEKLHDFHHHHFLDELESCLSEPLRVGRCFLRHRESFALYALYSKNKPQSDSLLINHGHGFFKQKQLKLGDKMDLWSYLLKPVQRISKYSLLLQDMMRECTPDQTREISEIKAAMEVINFQLRHGNNLLAMDAIRHCDVNLKEQGQLLRQDEFMVTFRKKKCCRHVFLFQELVLFSKTRKTDSGNDTYIYKQSFKTSDIGMTQNSGDSGLCFEIWFRKRKSEDTYTLQAASREMKEAWTRELEQILWEQAIHNREVRMQERVFLGIGNKPFIDIQPSEAAIHDRAINYALMGRENKVLLPCGSKVQPSGARPKSIGSGSSSASSSSSGRGSLSPEGYVRLPKRRVVSDGGYASPPGSLEEDDLDQESGSHNLLLDSSESSGESVCGLSSSGHSFRSAVGGEMDDTSSVCAPIKTHHQAEALVGFSKAHSATGPVVKTQPPVAPKPKHKALHWNKDPSFSSKVQDTGAGKSTEV